MALTPEQIKELKAQLYEQVAHLPPEQRKAAEQQINSLSPEALESMIKQQQGASAPKESKKPKEPEKPILRKIIDKEIPSVIVDENTHAIAVLDILPISEGHTIVIPKLPAKTAKDIPAQALALAKKIAKRLITNLKATSAQLITETKFGETIINVLPSYDSSLTLESPRSKTSIEALEKIAKKIRPVKKRPLIKIKTENKNQPLKLPRRIP